MLFVTFYASCHKVLAILRHRTLAALGTYRVYEFCKADSFLQNTPLMGLCHCFYGCRKEPLYKDHADIQLTSVDFASLRPSTLHELVRMVLAAEDIYFDVGRVLWHRKCNKTRKRGTDSTAIFRNIKYHSTGKRASSPVLRLSDLIEPCKALIDLWASAPAFKVKKVHFSAACFAFKKQALKPFSEHLCVCCALSLLLNDLFYLFICSLVYAIVGWVMLFQCRWGCFR